MRRDRNTVISDNSREGVSVGSVLPLKEVRAAHEMLAGAPHKRGKIVLRTMFIERLKHGWPLAGADP
jgi:hypothetical protein